MTRFVIEREIPGAKDLTRAQLATIARTSNEAAASLGVPYTWVTSYVAAGLLCSVSSRRAVETDLRGLATAGRRSAGALRCF